MMARARSSQLALACGGGRHEGLRGPVGTSGSGSYRVPYGYVTDMNSYYVINYISQHNSQHDGIGFVTAIMILCNCQVHQLDGTAMIIILLKNRCFFGGFVTDWWRTNRE